MLLLQIMRALCRRVVRQLQVAERGLHCTYLASVATFAHGLYAYAAGALLVVVALLWVAGED